MYEYKAQIVRVVDTDILELNIDLGLGVARPSEKVRLARISVPKKETPAGEQALLFIGQFVGQKATIRTLKDRWGTYQVEAVVEHHDKLTNLSDLLVNNGYAVLGGAL